MQTFYVLVVYEATLNGFLHDFCFTIELISLINGDSFNIWQ